MEKMELMDELQVHYKDFVKRMKGRVSYDDYETQSLLEGYTEELASFISKELDKAREEGRKEQAELDRSIYGMSFEEFDKKYKPVSKLNK